MIEVRSSNQSLARILVVDDDMAVASELKEALGRQGYDVLVVNRGADAQRAAERFAPDLIVLDVMMPGVDGWEVLRRIRAHPTTESLPVIMLTAADGEAALVHGFGLGADDYITKPFGLRELRCRIAAVLRRSAGPETNDDGSSIPVITDRPGFELLRPVDVYYVQGFHNYTHVHTIDSRFLCRLSLPEIVERCETGFMRVQRSFVVNLDHVRSCGWVGRSLYQLRLGNLDATVVPVSRALVRSVQERLGVRP